MLKRLLCLAAACLMLALPALAQEDGTAEAPAETDARQELIDRIIETGHQLYIKANGKLQRAHYASDIYVCKNFTVHVFKENAGDYRMAEYPDVALVIPDNLPPQQCKPYAYGFYWEDVPASEGNPFYVAAQFIYDPALSKSENMALAEEFMKNVRRGDYFQMSADYYYGVGAHSAIMISDYDPETNTVRWMDSNMRGGKRDGIRYGMVQYDSPQKDSFRQISWWADAFCHKNRGATIYRLRDDIIRK
ncbi:MAG: hypothetical protein IJ662_02180 [Clostridia bacterium]|nr:hypothetical protein [Clostridia bacterium]